MGEEPKRRISFSADSVLTAVVQDADTSELVRILDNHGEEVRINQTNHVGLTALHHGVLSNNLDAVKLLLCNGADVNLQDVHGFSPLHTAAACGLIQVCSLLLMFGADLFALTSQKELPIDVAKDLAVVRLLSDEMRQKVHQDVFLSSFFTYKTWESLYYLRKYALRVISSFVQHLIQIWKRHRSKFTAATTTRNMIKTNESGSTCNNSSNNSNSNNDVKEEKNKGE